VLVDASTVVVLLVLVLLICILAATSMDVKGDTGFSGDSNAPMSTEWINSTVEHDNDRAIAPPTSTTASASAPSIGSSPPKTASLDLRACVLPRTKPSG
jgi:hypothetical protein